MPNDPVPNPNPNARPGHVQVPVDRIDPNVVLPPHVKAAIVASDAAHTAVYNPPEGEAAAPNGSVPPAAPAPNGHQPPAAPAPAETPPAETNPDGTPNYENLYKALKGRHAADHQRFRETQEQYEQRMRELEQRTRPRLPGEDPPPTLVSQKEIDDYGADLIDVIKRAAQEAVIPLLKPIATTVGQVQARVETTENETGRQFLQRMHGSMDTLVPGWNDLNRDEKFIAWTKRPDVYSGLNRQELLQKAWYAGDPNRVAAFFQGFLAEEAATDPAAFEARQRELAAHGGHAPQPASPAPHQSPPRVTLEQLAAPGRARAAAPAPAGKPVWTAEGIASFYQDVAQGKFRGRDAERLATEADLMSAQREGRIQINPRTATQVGR